MACHGIRYIQAFIPPDVRRVEHDGRRSFAVAPASELPLAWHVRAAPGNMLRRYLHALPGPPPGNYAASTLVSVVFGLPRGQQPVRKHASVVVVADTPVSPMLPLTWLGGLLVRALQVVHLRPGEDDRRLSAAGELARKLLAMAILVAVVIIISAGFEGFEILPHLGIETRIASVAAGMPIQVAGYPYFPQILEREGDSSRGEKAGRPSFRDSATHVRAEPVGPAERVRSAIRWPDPEAGKDPGALFFPDPLPALCSMFRSEAQ